MVHRLTSLIVSNTLASSWCDWLSLSFLSDDLTGHSYWAICSMWRRVCKMFHLCCLFIHPSLLASGLLSSLSETPSVTRSLQSSSSTRRTQTVWICSQWPSAQSPPRPSLTCWSGCRTPSGTIENSILLCSCSYWVGFAFSSGSFIPQLVFRFLRRKTLLQTLRADDLSLLESAPKRWKSFESPSAEDRITGKMFDIMLITSLTCHSPQIINYYIWQVD